ncbi:HlyD family type I secretion periplasmic adaptor subunit [Iodidimonas muriae]|uniref:Membrane fusion protein (MFP) family protein n=1 Tax=Iodidimonas muriae TaxID=261467 RepID=A0ABQ2L5W0_9PROT|nr:HlyD family type I secretion periplasmic adaptor subunit [Iodidimonas muriae]GER06385.1 HlyD family type I secretion periplasmic adaptor subunit [Kordiimonadales bacterium JCM 17843]GGO04558.1 HlyD family type I secretion periplasmic adaptor subunit [Iodidimonas muriae]
MSKLPAASENADHKGRHSLPSLRFTKGERQVLSRSVYLEETGPSLGIYGIIFAITGLIAVFIIWSALTRLDETVAARGSILPASFVQPVQHLEGGIVSSVAVNDGDYVEAGDEIVTMDHTLARSDYLSLKVREASLALQIERLRAFALGKAPDFSVYVGDYPDLVADQKAIYSAQAEARDAQIAIIDSQIIARQQEVNGLREHLIMLEKQRILLAEELDMRKTLLDKGLTNKVVYLDTQRRSNQVEGEIARTRSEIARAEADVAQAQGSRLEIEERLRGDALEQLGRFSNDQAEINEQLTQLSDRVDRTVVRAPVAGRVAGLSVTGPGGVLPPGALIAEIVPDNNGILAEGRISPRDIGHITVGQTVTVKVDTYDYTRFGGVTGTVKSVSATSFKDEDGNFYFKCLISLDKNYVGNDPRNNAITAGMTLVADIKTGEKSLLGYLWRPVQQSLSGAFTER